MNENMQTTWIIVWYVVWAILLLLLILPSYGEMGAENPPLQQDD